MWVGRAGGMGCSSTSGCLAWDDVVGIGLNSDDRSLSPAGVRSVVSLCQASGDSGLLSSSSSITQPSEARLFPPAACGADEVGAPSSAIAGSSLRFGFLYHEKIRHRTGKRISHIHFNSHLFLVTIRFETAVKVHLASNRDVQGELHERKMHNGQLDYSNSSLIRHIHTNAITTETQAVKKM